MVTNFTTFIILFFIGMANALPLPLSGSTLSIWLKELGFEKSFIGLFSLATLPLTFKCLWSLIIDAWRPPFFKNSPRKGWLCFALAMMGSVLISLGLVTPTPVPLFFLLVVLSIFTGCLYMVGLSYELESLPEEAYAAGSSFVTIGYRVGLLIAGSGALFLAYFLDWATVYQSMGCLLLFSALLVASQKEPFKSGEILKKKQLRYQSYPSLLHAFWYELLKEPIKKLFQNSHFYTLMLILFSFKIGDHLAQSMIGPFYLELGFNKAELAAAAKLWGFSMTISGTLLGGAFLKQKEPFQAVVLTSLLHALSLSGLFFLSLKGKSMLGLYLVVALENLTGGLAMSAFILLLWKQCTPEHSAMQYALMWSFFSFKADLLGCLGGFLASQMSWSTFYFFIFVVSSGFTKVLHRYVQNAAIDAKTATKLL